MYAREKTEDDECVYNVLSNNKLSIRYLLLSVTAVDV